MRLLREKCLIGVALFIKFMFYFIVFYGNFLLALADGSAAILKTLIPVSLR